MLSSVQLPLVFRILTVPLGDDLFPFVGDFVTEFFKLCRRKESTDEILGKSAFEEEGKGLNYFYKFLRLPTLSLLEEQAPGVHFPPFSR